MFHRASYQPPDFQISVDRTDRRVSISGELDIATVPLMVEAAALLQSRPGDITIDLELVTFIDAATLGALVLLTTQQRQQAAQLHVLGNAHVSRIAQLGGLPAMVTPSPIRLELAV
jgi:anti-anti-sigma factor